MIIDVKWEILFLLPPPTTPTQKSYTKGCFHSLDRYISPYFANLGVKKKFDILISTGSKCPLAPCGRPCTYDSIITETEDLIDLQSDFGMKALFKEAPYTEVWVHLLSQNAEA